MLKILITSCAYFDINFQGLLLNTQMLFSDQNVVPKKLPEIGGYLPLGIKVLLIKPYQHDNKIREVR